MRGVYNLLSIVFLILTVVAILCTVALMSGSVNPPTAFTPRTAVPIPTLNVIPSLIPSSTPTDTSTPPPTLPATWTPEGGGALSNPASQSGTVTPAATEG